MNYNPKTTEDYLNTLKDYSEEQLENVRRVRDTHQYMSFEQYKMLLEQKQLKRHLKLKQPRTLWVNEEGEIFYLSHYFKQFIKMAEFLPETE